jgi:hypothetical protein
LPNDTPYFTLEQARALMPGIVLTTDEIARTRADLVELRAALATGDDSPLGGLAELKSLDAQLHRLLDTFHRDSIVVKGWAPVLIDFPAILNGEPVYLCWLEGEPELAWYHREELGFAGRRRIPEDGEWLT